MLVDGVDVDEELVEVVLVDGELDVEVDDGCMDEVLVAEADVRKEDVEEVEVDDVVLEGEDVLLMWLRYSRCRRGRCAGGCSRGVDAVLEELDVEIVVEAVDVDVLPVDVELMTTC